MAVYPVHYKVFSSVCGLQVSDDSNFLTCPLDLPEAI